MSKHTPGPWTVATPGKSIKGPDKKSIAAIVANAGRTNRPFEEREANARLIAAAPDFLVLLQRTNETLAHFGVDEDLRHDIVQAITKATGGDK